jgi:hypothetical protein
MSLDWKLILRDFFAMTPGEAAMKAANGNADVARHMKPYFIKLVEEWRRLVGE